MIGLERLLSYTIEDPVPIIPEDTPAAITLASESPLTTQIFIPAYIKLATQEAV